MEAPAGADADPAGAGDGTDGGDDADPEATDRGDGSGPAAGAAVGSGAGVTGPAGETVDADRSAAVDFGEAWVYESIVGALPGVAVSERAAIAIQLVVFEVAILALAAVYGLWTAAVAGTAAVVVAAAGSAVMLRLGDAIRSLPAPEAYRRLLFGSSVEVVLGVLAFIALVTHLFVYDPRVSTTPLVESLFGPEPPVLVVYLTLLVLWDVTYRIGTSWWASVVSVWRSWRYEFDPETAAAYRRVDATNFGFSLVQLLLVPFLLDRPVLLTVVLGHVGAVAVTATASILLLGRAGDGDDDGESPAAVTRSRGRDRSRS